MPRKQGSAAALLPDLPERSTDPGHIQALRRNSRTFTLADQVNRLVGASETTPDRGFLGRTIALCSLPRSNPGNRHQYKRVNGPYKLIMIAGGDNKLPFGTNPRLILAWVCTEAVRTGSRDIVLGRSLSEFMRKLGISSTDGRGQARLRNQMDRLFNCSVSMIYKDEHGKQFVNSHIANRGEFWWNERKPDQPALWESKVRLSEEFFNEIIRHPVPLDMNTLKALKRSPLGLDLYLWLVYRIFALTTPQTDHLAAGVPSVRRTPGQSQQQVHRPCFPVQGATRVEKDQAGLEGLELHHASGPPDPLSIGPEHFPDP